MINNINPNAVRTAEQPDKADRRPKLSDDLIESIVLASTSSRLQDQATLVLLSKSNKALFNRVRAFNSRSEPRVISPQARVFCSRLASNDPAITKVDLSDQVLCLNDLEILADALVVHRQSQHILMPNCKLGDTAGSQLIDKLAAKPTVEYLGLSNNQLADSSVQSLVGFVRQHPELRVLDLGFNFIGDLGFQSLFDLLTTHPNLKSVGLVYCGLSSNSLAVIREFHACNPDKANLFQW